MNHLEREKLLDSLLYTYGALSAIDDLEEQIRIIDNHYQDQIKTKKRKIPLLI